MTNKEKELAKRNLIHNILFGFTNRKKFEYEHIDVLALHINNRWDSHLFINKPKNAYEGNFGRWALEGDLKPLYKHIRKTIKGMNNIKMNGDIITPSLTIL